MLRKPQQTDTKFNGNRPKPRSARSYRIAVTDEVSKRKGKTQMATQAVIKENAMQRRAELLDAINNFQREVNLYISTGNDEINSWQPKLDSRFNDFRRYFKILDSWWDSVVEASEEN